MDPNSPTYGKTVEEIERGLLIEAIEALTTEVRGLRADISGLAERFKPSGLLGRFLGPPSPTTGSNQWPPTR